MPDAVRRQELDMPAKELSWQTNLGPWVQNKTAILNQTSSSSSKFAELYRMPSEAFRLAFARVAELQTLEANWDSYGAQPISALATSAARSLLFWIAASDQQELSNKVPFFIAPLANGGVQLEWREDGLQLEVEVEPNSGAYSYLLTDDKGFAQSKQQVKRGDIVSLLGAGLANARAR